MLILGIVIVFFVIVLIVSLLNLYTVVEPNKAHVVVSFGSGRHIYHPSMSGKKSAYFFIPMFMKRIIVSLENVKHEINEIELRDAHFAPFKCDITCWFKIENPDFAAEKLDVDRDGNIMNSIRETLNAQVQGVVRAASMKQEVMELMKDRTTFGESVFKEVNGDLDSWGIQLVKLEIIDFSDLNDTHVIRDYEARRESEISSMTRQTVAKNNQDAKVAEAIANKTSEVARINAEQEAQMRDIERNEATRIRDEAARLKVAETTEKANQMQVEAEKTKAVGQTKYEAEAKIALAEGEKTSRIKIAEGEAQANKARGIAQAEVVERTGTAEASAIEKKADAQKKFQDASKDIEMAKIAADIRKTQFTATAQALATAKIQIISKDMSFMGFGAEQGAGLDVLLSNSGIDLNEAIKSFTGNKSKDDKSSKSK